jgi:hypothetical protein
MSETGSPATSPWVWEASDYQGRAIRITVTFDNTSRALSGATLFRASGCLFGHIYIGTGPDGSPNTTTKSFVVPVGTRTATAAQMATVGLNTIEDILSYQITAGP